MTTATRKEITTHIEKCGISLVLPWPDLRLSPNSRKPHRWLTNVRSIARNTGFFAAKEAGWSIPDRTPLHLYLTFCPPDHRRRDDDNLIGAFKSYRDGIFKALCVDDSNVKLTTYGIGKKTEGGAVIVKVVVIRPERIGTK
jgi:crossover junction endodeoxyribonuclease RusA